VTGNFCKFYDLAMGAVTQEQEHKLTWSRIRNTLKDTYDALVNMKFILPNIGDKVTPSSLFRIFDLSLITTTALCVRVCSSSTSR
jgi:hypothetical protein